MTLEEVRQAIGHERPAWAEELGSSANLVILVRAAREGDAVLVANAHGKTPCYHWIGASGLTRRADLDNNREPAWLQRARHSSRPPVVLHDILNPTYSERALEAAAPAPPNTPRAVVDELTYRSYAYNRVRSPHLTPEQWGRVFDNWQELEARFQADACQVPSTPFTLFGGDR